MYMFQEVISTPYIIFTKAKSCDWLVTRIREEITSKNYIKKIHRKRSKVESAKKEENSHHAWAVRIWKVLCEFRTSFAQAESVVRISRCCANFAQAWSSCLPNAISSSFQLQIIHSLKSWILDFLSFEMVYSMQKMEFGKCSKSAKEDYSCCPMFSSFSLCLFFLFACFSSLLLSFTWLVLMIQKAVNILKLATNMIRSHCQVLNMPIGIKMENYYTKVLKT